MKVFTFVFVFTRNLLGFFGFGQGNCLYYPTCSEVIVESFNKDPIHQTIFLGIKRVATCNPIHRKLVKNGNN